MFCLKKKVLTMTSLKLLVILLSLASRFNFSNAEVLVVDSTEKDTLAIIKSISASFGKPLPEEGIRGYLLKSKPQNGCAPIDPPPKNATFSEIEGINFTIFDFGEKPEWIAMISRYGGCTFQDKVRHAQNANYSAVIVYNVNSDKVIPMGGDDSTLIPSVFIGFSDAELLSGRYVHNMNPSVKIIMTDDEPFDINSYLLPFAIVVGICFLIMLGIVIFKCVQDHRRNRRHRLPKSALKRLPIHKFKTGDPFDTCCICLDDFEDGEKLRVLPCDHGYHAKCIDPWLVKNKRICPQCRKKVFASNEHGATLITGPGGSDSDDDQTTNERAPLLRQQTSSYGGTSSTASSTGPSRSRFFFARRGRRNAPPLDNRAEVSSSESGSDDESSSGDRPSTSQQMHHETGGATGQQETLHEVVIETHQRPRKLSVVTNDSTTVHTVHVESEPSKVNSVDNENIDDDNIDNDSRHVSAEIHGDDLKVGCVPDVIVVATEQLSDNDASQSHADSKEESV